MSVALKRDCEVTQIPSGTSIMLPASTQVDITQALGGTYTIRALEGSLFRISAKDADALGMADTDSKCDEPAAAGPVTEDAVWGALKTCFDPEIPVNIVDLGLVYDLQISSLPEGGSSVAVKMTLTAPGCGMGGAIAGDAQMKLLELPGVRDAHVEIVWDPPWHPSLITPAGKSLLGLE